MQGTVFGEGFNVRYGSRAKLGPNEGNFRKRDFSFNTRINFLTIMNCFVTEMSHLGRKYSEAQGKGLD